MTYIYDGTPSCCSMGHDCPRRIKKSHWDQYLMLNFFFHGHVDMKVLLLLIIIDCNRPMLKCASDKQVKKKKNCAELSWIKFIVQKKIYVSLNSHLLQDVANKIVEVDEIKV